MLKWSRNFSSSPVITTQRFHCRAPASVPGQGTKIHKLSSVAKKKKKSSKSNCKDGDSGIHLKAHMTGRRITKKRFKGSFSLSHTVTLCKCIKSRLHLIKTKTEVQPKAEHYRWGWRARRTPGRRWRSTSRCPSALRCPGSLAAGVCHQHLGTWEYWLWFQSGMSPALSYSIPQRPVCKTWKKTMWEKPGLYRRHSLNGLILLPCQYWRMLTTCSIPEATRLLSRTPQHFSHQLSSPQHFSHHLSFMLRVSCVRLQPVDTGLLITRMLPWAGCTFTSHGSLYSHLFPSISLESGLLHPFTFLYNNDHELAFYNQSLLSVFSRSMRARTLFTNTSPT